MPINPKKIMVTGGLGFIGSNFVELALSRGYTVVNVDKKTYAARVDVTFENNPNYEFIQEDICHMRSLPTGISYIVNFAAESHVDNSILSTNSFFESNTRGVYNILELIRSLPKEDRPILIHKSTDEVYGDILNGTYTEESRLTPSNPYSASKAAADQLISGWSRTYGLKSRICRSCNNYGFGQYAEKLIPKTIKWAHKGKKMTVHGDGSYRREWIYVGDCCQAVLAVLEKGKDGETYNISTAETLTNLEVVKTILREMGKPEDFYELVANRIGQDLRYSVSSEKIRGLGWKPSTTFAEYLPKYIKLCELDRAQDKEGMRSKITRTIKGIVGKK